MRRGKQRAAKTNDVDNMKYVSATGDAHSGVNCGADSVARQAAASGYAVCE